MIKRHSYQIPESVSDISEQPLYILIASWGLRNKKILTTDIVAKNFFITQRRAMDIMHYIKNEGRKNVDFEKVILFHGVYGNIRVQALKIKSVVLLPPQKINKERYNDSFKLVEIEQKKNVFSVKTTDEFSMIKRWLISRKVGSHFSDIERNLPSNKETVQAKI